MKPYADTNFFTAYLAATQHSEAAIALHDEAMLDPTTTLPVTSLIQMEFENAVQQMVFLARQGLQGLRFTPEQAMFVEARFEEHLATGNPWHRAKVHSVEFDKTFSGLVHRHTAKHGFRTYDIIHVASAIVLGCDTFWSFDAKARKLAKLEGLKLS